MQFTAETIAKFLNGEIEGDKGASVHTFAKIEEGHAGTISFLANPKYEHYIYETQSSIVIVSKEFTATSPVRTTLIRVDEPYSAFASLLRLYETNRPRPTGISPRASIADDVVLGEGCYVGDFAVIESGCKIGKNSNIYPQCCVGYGVSIGEETTLYAGVKVYEQCVIGNRVIIHSGAVIGADGFGFAPDHAGVYTRIPQLGNVIIEDDVNIGANTCVDRATMGSTVIHSGVKLDNLIQIGHNVVVGHDTVAAAQVGIAGSSKIGSNSMFGGQVGITGHLVLGNNVKVGSQSGVAHDVPDNTALMGSPALPGMKWHRSNAVFRNLPDLSLRISNLEKEVREIKKR